MIAQGSGVWPDFIGKYAKSMTFFVKVFYEIECTWHEEDVVSEVFE